MCLAVPAQLIKVNDQIAEADLHGNRVDICTALVPDALPGDWVLIHAGFAIRKLSCTEAEETFAVLEDLHHRTDGMSGYAGRESAKAQAISAGPPAPDVAGTVAARKQKRETP